MAWAEVGCRLIPAELETGRPFDRKLQRAAPLMYRSLLDVVHIMEDTARECSRCGPDLWNCSQEIRANLLDDLIRAELAEAGLREQ